MKGELIIPSDNTLLSLLGSREPVDWNTLLQKIISKMTKTYVITCADGRQVTRKSILPKIVFKVNVLHSRYSAFDNILKYETK